MPKPNSDHLLDRTEAFIRPGGRKPPRQTDLRHAISDAYDAAKKKPRHPRSQQSVGCRRPPRDIMDQDGVRRRVQFENNSPRSDPAPKLPLILTFQSNNIARQGLLFHLIERSIDSGPIARGHRAKGALRPVSEKEVPAHSAGLPGARSHRARGLPCQGGWRQVRPDAQLPLASPDHHPPGIARAPPATNPNGFDAADGGVDQVRPPYRAAGRR